MLTRRDAGKLFAGAAASATLPGLGLSSARAEEQENSSTTSVLLTGVAAFGDWRSDAPGVRRLVRPSDLPPPATGTSAETPNFSSRPQVVPRPAGAMLKVPEGFSVQVVASGLTQPRIMRRAPNGDVFLAESGSGRVLVFPADATTPAQPEVFAENLDRPYGIVFQPPTHPQYVYVAAANEVVRFPYHEGDTKAETPAVVIVANIPTTRHWTRDLAISRDGNRLFVAVGSGSNLAGDMPDWPPDQIWEYEKTHGRGATWGPEEDRAVVRLFDPEGMQIRNYATGLRNASGLAMQPGTDILWCVVNERDNLGPNVPPDYMARVREGGFYGWPWYYIGNHQDPRLRDKRPDLRELALVPDVLIQTHSAPLSLVFYDREAFPPEYRGDAFVTLHGSWNRPERTGYKVIRVRMRDGQPTGEYDDFLTGFVVNDDSVWGRPAGVAVTEDGALLVSDDANGTIFRVTHRSSL
ncbi:MAG: PQQ-dependent sugar dehydrogenase [Acetobacteraceae bacterium]